ncbi:MAG TPA: cell division protein ZipA C-terminal FtsZ-binding domain-containing protein [Gammaproteobacteria bacterium]
MTELRWVLLALGVSLVVGVYLWGKGLFKRNASAGRPKAKRAEPRISPELSPEEVLLAPLGQLDGEDVPDAEAVPESAEPERPEHEAAPPKPPRRSGPPEKVVALRFVPRSHELDGEEAVLALREAGLEHGRYGIFHYQDESCPSEAKFSVANLTEPGSFDLDHIAGQSLAGMSFFMVLPGSGDPVDRFDAMVSTARALALQFDAELFDDAGSSWSIQRERYVREELIRYRLQLAQP